MSDPVLTRIIVFGWMTASLVAVFTWFTVSHWITSRTAERKDRERSALLRHLAGQPGESARLVLEKVREDDEQARKDAAAQARFWIESQRRGMRESTPGARGGLVIVAFGVGLAFFLHAMAPEKGAWTIGAIPVLVGAVVTAFGIFTKQESGDERSG